MAIASKINGDLQQVSVLDAVGEIPGSPIYTSPVAATFAGTFLTTTTIQITELNGTAVTGQLVFGAGIPLGTTVVSVTAGNVMTVLTPAPEVIDASMVGKQVSMATAIATSMYTASKAVQNVGPKLDFYTFTVQANKQMQVIEAIQQRATVHMYEIISPTSLAVAFYPAGVYGGLANVLANVQAQCPPGLGISWLTAVSSGATFHSV